MLCILYVQTSNNYPKKIKKNIQVQCNQKYYIRKYKNKIIALQYIVCFKKL